MNGWLTLQFDHNLGIAVDEHFSQRRYLVRRPALRQRFRAGSNVLDALPSLAVD